MKFEKEQNKPSIPKMPSLEALELKADLNPEQKSHLEKLKAKMNKILGNKTAKQLAAEGDLESLKKYNAILDEILEFLRTKKLPEQIADKQIKKIENLISRLKVDMQDSDIKNIIKALEKQLELIRLNNAAKTKIVWKYRIDSKFIPDQERVFAGLFEFSKDPMSEDDIFLIERYFDSQGNLIKLELGVVGIPEYYYEYMLAGYAEGDPGFSTDTHIARYEKRTAASIRLGSPIAKLSKYGIWEKA